MACCVVPSLHELTAEEVDARLGVGKLQYKISNFYIINDTSFNMFVPNDEVIEIFIFISKNGKRIIKREQ